MSIAQRIDIKTELLAISQDECPLCRIAATHKRTSSCEKTPAFIYMQECSCGTVQHIMFSKGVCVDCGSHLGGE